MLCTCSYSARQLYNKDGPSKAENTMTYAPPEVLFADVPFDPKACQVGRVGEFRYSHTSVPPIVLYSPPPITQRG